LMPSLKSVNQQRKTKTNEDFNSFCRPSNNIIVFLVGTFQFPFSYLKITYSELKNEMKANLIPTKKCMFFTVYPTKLMKKSEKNPVHFLNPH
jgi:hypothetical protein